MGNNLDAYRAAIGLFRACKMSLNIGYDSHSDTFHDILITNLRCSSEPNTSPCVLKISEN
jgi:hypothetical protein